MSESARVQARLHEDGTLLEVVLDEPKANVLSMAMMRDLQAVLDEYAGRASLRLVVLRGAGRHFSFGASVAEHVAEQAPDMLSTFHAFVRRLAACPVPVAALVSGQCLGGAFEVVLACHFVFVTPSARLGCPEITLGVFPPVLAALGPLRLGGALSERLLLTGETIDAGQAVASGLASGLLEGEDAFAELVAWYGKALQPRSAWSLRQAVLASRLGAGVAEALGEPLDRLERLYVEQLVGSHDGNEGINAFLERRKPEWTDA